MNKGRVLITGSSGLIGRAIFQRLKSSERFQPVSPHLRSQASNIPLTKSGHIDLTIENSDSTIIDSIRPCEYIVHSAADMSTNLRDRYSLLTNTVGLQALISVATAWKPKCLIYMSGVTVVGVTNNLPIHEQSLPCPGNIYLASKLFGEHLVRIFSETTHTPCSILRVSAPIGVGMPSSRLLPTLISASLANREILLEGHGKRRQDYIDTRDVAEAVYKALACCAHGIYNIASGSLVSNYNLAVTVRELLNSDSHIRTADQAVPSDLESWQISVDKAKRCLGFNARYSLSDTIMTLCQR